MTQLVLLEAFANRELAEFAQLRLKNEGIESSLENATLMGWFWQFGVAVGGVKLFVDAADADEAHAILSNSDAISGPTEFCPHCDEALLPGWDVCWRCAPQVEQPQPLSEEEQSAAADKDRTLTAIAVAAGGLVTFFGLGLDWLLIYVAVIGTVKLLFSRGGEPPATETEQPRSIDAETVTTGRRSELADATAFRSWKAAVLGVIWFPPLTLYAVYLVMRIQPKRALLSATGRRHRRLAVAAILVTLAAWMALPLLLLHPLGYF